MGPRRPSRVRGSREITFQGIAMRNFTGSFVVLILASVATGCGGDDDPFDNFEQRSSYAVGMDIANNLQQMPADLEIEYLVRGLRDVLRDRETLLNDQQVAQVIQEFSMQMRQASITRSQEQALENQQAAAAFFPENGAKDGIVTTASGLQFEVLEDGDGISPGAEDEVTVHYRGTLLDGTEFDSSYERGEPITFPLRGVIPGWTEGLQLMKTGGKYRLYVPAALGYGSAGSPPVIGPDAALIFEVELLEVIQ